MVVRASGVIPGEYLTAMVGKDYAKDILKDPEGSKYYCEFIDSLSLLSLRRDGSLNDGQQYLDYTGHPFEDIKAPSLILHGSKDSFVQPSESTTLHETLPNSDYIEIKGGTHFMIISHHDVLAPIINDFLNTHAPSK
jgi:pimeloyl-ACP methyl ester carboxylesterase